MMDSARSMLDSQQIEILGRSILVASIVADGFECATPERDRGIDLIMFSIDPWKVVPIQMKASRQRVFSVHRKYEAVPNLVMAYVWDVQGSGTTETYAMTWQVAAKIAQQLGWTKTASWERAGYTTTRPSARVIEALGPHKVLAGGWHRFL